MKKNNLLSKSILVLIAILSFSILIYKTTASADKAKPNPQLIRRARLSDDASVRSTARPTPSINFSDGRDLLTDYDEADRARLALEDNTASPAALASADFDKDGAPDLICAYKAPGGGIIALHKGNLDSIYPNSPQANQRKASGAFTDAPFLSPARAFELPQSPDFIGAGDFDADGNQDLLVASRGSNRIFLLSGDGQAGFSAPKTVQLPGVVTAIATGEMNRADGLADIVVGVVAADGAKAVVYESLEGTSRATPEAFDLPSQPAALALGRVDDDYLMDLAVAAGKEVFVIRGRDRHLQNDGKNKTKQSLANKRRFSSAVRSIAIGSFIDKDKPSLAVLTEDGMLRLLGQSETKKNSGKKSGQINKWNEQTLRLTGRSEQLVQARVSCAQTESLVAIDSVSHQMQIIAADPYNKASSASASVAVFDVEGGAVATLPIKLNRSAIDNLVILRNGQTSPTVMTPQVMMTFTVTNTSDAGVNSFMGAIQAANANPGLDNIVFDVGTGPITINLTGSLPTITDPVVIDGTTQPGFAGNPIVEINGGGTVANGLSIPAGDTTVRGLVINRVGFAIDLGESANNLIQGNFIGTNLTGTGVLENDVGVFIQGGTNNTIGGAAAAARNIISGNGNAIQSFGSDNIVQNNFIGTDVTGAVSLGNDVLGFNGGGSNTVIRGNIISGNASGGILIGGSPGALIQGNRIGTDVTGTLNFGNGEQGIDIFSSQGAIIGGTAPETGNVISGNEAEGVLISGSGVTANLVQGNFIGTDASGVFALGNGSSGLKIANGASSNIIGGLAASAGNVIAFNGLNGVTIESGTSNSILSNSIFSNGALGIDLGSDGVTPNDAGDADAGANNLQNFPQLTSANVSLGSTFVQGTLNSAPNTTFTLQFFSNTDCNPSGFGEGKQLIGTRTIQTDQNGNAIISFSFPGNFSLPVTATATDPSGNTSEFSPCAVSAILPDLAISMAASPASVKAGDTLTYTITITNQGASIASNVTVLDSLPASVTLISCAATGNGLCLGSGNNARITFGALPAGAQATVTLVTTVNTLASSDLVIINTATVSATNGDSNPANNSATAITAIAGAPSLIACPANIVINASAGQCSVATGYPLPTITDSRFNLTVVCLPPPGSIFPVGTTTVNCQARDAEVIRGACSFTITVNAPQSVKVTLEGGAAALSFGPAKAKRKTKNPPDGCDCDSTFTIENTGCGALNLTLDSIMRTGNDVTSGRISNPDDSKTFFVSLTGNNQPETVLAIGAIVSIPVGQSRSFRVLFKPGFPAITGKSTGLAAADILPDVVTSKITFRQNGIEPIVVNLVGRIVTDVRIINPDDARGPKLARFTKSGNEFTVIFGVFDADLDANRATFEFLDGNGQVVQQAFDVDIAQPISQNNIIKGQSFVITQSFTGATSHPEVVSVRVKVSDPHSSDSVTAQLGSSASAATAQSSRGAVILPVRKFESLP